MDQETIKKLVIYKDGKLYWLISPTSSVKIGDEAVCTRLASEQHLDWSNDLTPALNYVRRNIQ